LKHLLRGLFAVFIFGGLLYWGWTQYHEFLTSGMKPTEGVQKLNDIEKNGAPDFEFNALDGRAARLSEFGDKIVILNFWASWCEPCVTEFPSMLKLVEFFRGQVVLVAVSADYTREDIDRFLKGFPDAKNSNVYIYWDKERKIAEQYGTEVLPESYIFRKGLKFFRKVAGSENWFDPGAVELFHELTR